MKKLFIVLTAILTITLTTASVFADEPTGFPAEFQSMAETETEMEPVPETEIIQEAETELEPEIETEPEAETEEITEPEAETETEIETEVESEAEETEPEVTTEIVLETETEETTEAISETTAEDETTAEEIEEAQVFTGFDINPLYEGLLEESDLHSFNEPASEIMLLMADPAPTFYDGTDAALYIRENMTMRNEVVDFIYYSKEDPATFAWKTTARSFVNTALLETGVSNQGDYIRWQYGGVAYKASIEKLTSTQPDGYTLRVTFKLTFTYYTTLEQENIVTSTLSNLYQELKLSEKSDYEKIRTIYDYICENITYDYGHTGGESYYYLKHTAYAALIDKTCVCQGYALLFYRMALDNGLKSRLVAGTANGVNHGWNIVEYEGIYYYLDPTWDAGFTENGYIWFMQGSTTFAGPHKIRTDLTPNFNYNISETDLDYSLLDDNITEISLEDAPIYLTAGEFLDLNPIILPSDTRAPLTFESSNPDIIQVYGQKKSCILEGISAGKTTITIASPSKTVEMEIEIRGLFNDMSNPSSTFFNAVNWVVDQELLDTDRLETFGVDTACTRAELVLMLYRLSGSTSKASSLSFSDCEGYRGTDIYDAIAWAEQQGIVKGYSDGTFRPNRSVTRKTAMIMLYRFAGKPAVSGKMKFLDCKKYAEKTDTYRSILWGTQNKITNGTSSITFSPDSSCFKKHAALFLYKFAR